MFKWNEKLSVGNERVDDQHKRLFEIAASIYQTLKSDQYDKYDAITALLEELVDYTIYHFSSEEKLMASKGIIITEEHKRAHEDFILKITEMKSLDIDRNQEEVLLETLNFIADWITKHILEIDVKQFNEGASQSA